MNSTSRCQNIRGYDGSHNVSTAVEVDGMLLLQYKSVLSLALTQSWSQHTSVISNPLLCLLASFRQSCSLDSSAKSPHTTSVCALVNISTPRSMASSTQPPTRLTTLFPRFATTSPSSTRQQYVFPPRRRLRRPMPTSPSQANPRMAL